MMGRKKSPIRQQYFIAIIFNPVIYVFEQVIIIIIKL